MPPCPGELWWLSLRSDHSVYIHRSYAVLGDDLSPLNCNFISLGGLAFFPATSVIDSCIYYYYTHHESPEQLMNWHMTVVVSNTGPLLADGGRDLYMEQKYSDEQEYAPPISSCSRQCCGCSAMTTGQFYYLQSKSTAYAVQKFLWLRQRRPTLTSMWSFCPINT